MVCSGLPPLMCLHSEEALANIVPRQRENARVAAFGAKLSSKGLGSSLNPVLRMLFNLSF